MGPSVFKRNPKNRERFDLGEVFYLETLLKTRYLNVETIQVVRNFVHDRDLSAILTGVENAYTAQAHVLETRAKRARLKAPGKPPTDQRTSAAVQLFTDKFIYELISREVRSDVFVLSRAVRSSTTNDALRSLFAAHLRDQIGNLDTLVRYGKVKGWPHTITTIKPVKTSEMESLSVGEGYNLWDHLSLRYDQWQLTKFFAGFAHDLEYRAMLEAGASRLIRQAGQLEQIMLREEIPLPSRPPETMKSPLDPEVLEDQFTYRIIFRGLQEAVDLHLRGTVDAERNDAVRRLFSSFLFEEITLLDRFLRYGKAKGWLAPSPLYGEPVQI